MLSPWSHFADLPLISGGVLILLGRKAHPLLPCSHLYCWRIQKSLHKQKLVIRNVVMGRSIVLTVIRAVDAVVT